VPPVERISIPRLSSSLANPSMPDLSVRLINALSIFFIVCFLPYCNPCWTCKFIKTTKVCDTKSKRYKEKTDGVASFCDVINP